MLPTTLTRLFRRAFDHFAATETNFASCHKKNGVELYDDSTVGDPHATIELQGYDQNVVPTPRGSKILPIGSLNAYTVLV